MADATNSSAAKGAIWSTIDKFGIVTMQFVINIVLARLLTPDDFGLVGMILIIVAVSTIVADGGFSSALIQKCDATDKDYSTAFWINLTISGLLYGVIFIFAPLIAESLGYPILCSLLRSIGIVMVFNSMGLVARVKLKRQFAFKKIALSNIGAYILSAAIAIIMSRRGYGAWSLVAMHIVNTLFSNAFIMIAAHWKPSTEFSYTSLKQLFTYGEYMLISDILSNICFHIQGTLVGKYFTPYIAGQYAQAKKMEEVACITLPSAMVQVLFPLYSRLQHNVDELRERLRDNTRLIAFVIFPLLTILIIIAKPLIMLLFGPKWIEAIPFFQVLCIGGFFCSLQYFNYYAVAATGRSRVLFFTGVFKSLFTIGSILIAVHIDMTAVLIAMVASNVVNYITNAIVAHIYINYSVARQLLDVAPIFATAITVGLAIYYIGLIWNINWLLLAAIYSAVYVVISYKTESKALNDVICLLKRGLKRDM